MQFLPRLCFAFLCLLHSSASAQSLPDRLDQLFAAAFPSGAPGATVIITQGGATLFRKAYGQAQQAPHLALEPGMPMRLASVTKQFTAVAILLLADEGKLSLDDDITRFLPAYPTHGNKITIAHLLTHTSGIADFTSLPGFAAIENRDLGVAQVIDFFKDAKPAFAPGQRWDYSNSGYVLLGAIIEKVSGQPYADFLAERIFTPLGMQDTAYEGRERSARRRVEGYHRGLFGGFKPAPAISMSVPYAAGALVSTVDDLARWDAAVSAGKLLKPASWQRAFTPCHAANGPCDYGLGWSIGSLLGHVTQGHSGGIPGFSTHAMRVPDQQLYVAVLANTDNPAVDPGALVVKAATLVMNDIAPKVDVQIRLAGPGMLDVAYTLPPACQSLRFDKSAAAVRASWEPVDGCGLAGADTLGRGNKACPVLRFRVPATASRVNGYPAAFPVGDGVYVHTSNYAVGDSCGKVGYRFSAPGIAVEGRAAVQEAAGSSGDAAALLLPAPLPKSDGTLAYFDPHLSLQARSQVRTVADGTVRYLKAALPDAVFVPPILAAAMVSEPGGPSIGGDASDVLRVALYNWPAQPGPSEQAKLTLLVAHEFSHRFQMRDAVDTYADARLIHEGGGEFLRWLVSVEQGWMTREQAVEDLDNALAQCLLYTDGKSWRSLSAREIGGNRLEYLCGLPTYVYALAARQGPGGAVQRINDFYAQLRRGKQPAFATALECGAASACTPRWVPLLLDAGPLERQWHAMLATTGLAQLRAPTTVQNNAMALRALIKLMHDDCGGASGTTETPDSVLLDGMKACKTFVRAADVVRIEGKPVFGDAGTLPAMAAACSNRHIVALGMRDGATLDAPCTEPYHAYASFYHADIDKVLASLLRH